MNRAIRDLARKISPALFAYLKGLRLLVDEESFLVSSGLLHSYKTDLPARPDGSPLPWMNYNIIAFLEARLNKSLVLFEYGSGYSTLFFASLVARVVSVEHDPQWYKRVEQIIPPNVDLIYKPLSDGGYPHTISESDRRYDVVVVDGRERVACAQAASQALSPRGVIIFDDTHRTRYEKGVKHLLTAGFKRIDFIGFKPLGIEMDQSSIFYRSGNCLDI